MLLEKQDDDLMVFSNRAEAGHCLATMLMEYAGKSNVLVLALPRGGVVVGREVARIIHVPLDIFIVRKLGVPVNPELAMGAIASGGVRVLNQAVIASLRIPPTAVDAAATRELRHLRHQEGLYRKSLPALDVQGQTVILVDDGAATGATMGAAIVALRQLGAARIVAALPVAPISAYYHLKSEADEVACLITPQDFVAVSEWYDDFHAVSDREIAMMLERATAPSGAA